MSYRRIIYVLGAVVASIGVSMFVPVAVSLVYQEWSHAAGIAVAALITIGAGVVAWRLVGRQGELSTREGFATVGLAWFAIAAFGMLPYLVTQDIGDVTNAFFETAAGFTTTGSSVIADPGELSHGIQLWRALTQWMGGMGVIVLGVAILPLLGVGGVQLARAESPGPQPDRLTPRFQETAKRLWFVYLGFTLAETVLLFAGDMTLFEAIAHSLTTMSTGGFSTSPRSLAGFNAYSQWIVILFMTMAGTSFALHFRALRKPLEYTRNAELRLYATVLVAAAVVMAIGTWGGEAATTIRDAVFTAVSLVTTTGYATADFGVWPGGLQIMVVGLMFIGGMAGSTAGSVKTFRIGVLTNASRADLRRLIHPRGVFVARFGREAVPDPIVESVQSFFLLYMFLFMTGTVVFGLTGSALESSNDLVTSATAVASALGNIGPGLSQVGPTSTFEAVSAPNKWLLSFLMIVGRLEIFPVILLFTRELWRR